MSNSVCVDDPSLMLERSLGDVSSFLEMELNERIENGMVPLTGMVFDGYSEDGTPVRLEVRLSVRNGDEK